ncbi:MAG: rhodanese-like domain-containing protein [Bacteroidota bacterium]
MEKITVNDLRRLSEDENAVLLDVRSIDAYNGWKRPGENRGGHIPGAKTLPSHWATYIDWIEILMNKNITNFRTIVVYGDKPAEIKHVCYLLEKTGHKDVRYFEDFTEMWLNNPDMPVSMLPRYQHLVPPWWLKQVAEGKKPDHMYGGHAVICHVHYRNPDDYKAGHIPGSIPLDTNDLESPETWNRRSPEELESALTSHGINKNSTVILYGRFSHPDNKSDFPGSNAGQLGAMRAAAIMLYAGVKDVKILNGGLQAWRDARFPVVREESKAKPVGDFGDNIPGRPELMIDTPEAKELIKSEQGEIVSIRSLREWTGEVSGYNYIDKKGHIPGAVFGNCGTDAYHMENYRNLDHSMREYQETEANWREIGVTPDKKIAFYCGTGWRGSEAFLNAWLMGWPNVSVYDGGWFEWSNDPDNPISTKETD